MYTFVTGGTGFLGQHLLGKLAQQHKNLKVLTRSYSPSLNVFDVKQVIGDILDEELLYQELQDCNEVYHLAGLVERNPDQSTQMYAIHVDGTRNLFDAIRRIEKETGKQPIRKIVVASSSGTVAVSTEPDQIADDDAPYADETVAHWPYYLSKIYQERVIDRYIKHFNLPIVTMRPTLLLGPGDTRKSSTEDVIAFLNGEIKVIPKGGLSFVDVRDAADAFITAMERAPIGRKYLLGATNMTLQAFFETLATMTNKPTPVVMDESIVKTGAFLMRRLRKTFKQKESAAFDATSVSMAHHYWYLDCTRAKSELNWHPRDMTLTLRDTITWIENHDESRSGGDRRRKRPPVAYVPQETLDYADKIRSRDPHDRS